MADHCLKLRFYIVVLITLLAIIPFAGCGNNRDLSSPEKSLLGHWIEEDGGSEYWISEDTYITIDHDREPPNLFEIPYEVIRSDKEENWITIGIVEEEDSEFWNAGDISLYREIFISDDGLSLHTGVSLDSPGAGEVYIESIQSTLQKWFYVDGETEP